MTLAEFTRWVDDVLERETFRPPIRVDADGDAGARRGRRHAAGARDAASVRRRVLPGADDRPPRRAAAVAIRCCRDATRRALGAARAGRRCATPSCSPSRSCCGLPRVTLLAAARRRRRSARRRARSSSGSRWRWSSAVRRASAPGATRAATAPIARAPIRRDRAVGARRTRLPAASSASTFEALRACPYRFFAAARAAACVTPTSSTPRSRSATTATGCTRCCMPSTASAASPRRRRRRRRAPARDRRSEPCAPRRARRGRVPAVQRLASRCFVPRYVAWLHERERRGRRWQSGEVELRVAPEALERHRAARRHRPHRPPSTAAARARADRLQDRQRRAS